MGRRVVVVGGGISGLCVAWHLRQMNRDVEIQVLERADSVGGTAQTRSEGGYLLETGPNGFLDSREATLNLCRELGLEGELIRAHPDSKDRFVFLGDKLRRLPGGPVDFLRTDLLSFAAKIRLLWERFVPPRIDDVDESIFDFGCRRIGREATENFLDPFVTGILAGDYQLLSLPACFPRMREMERKYGGLFRALRQISRERRSAGASAPTGSPQGTLTTLAGGMGKLTGRLAEQLDPHPKLNWEAETLSRTGTGAWRLCSRTGAEVTGDAVVLTCPTFAQGDLLAPFDPELGAELTEIPYAPAVVCVIGFRRGDLANVPGGFGYLAPERLGRAVLGVIYSSSIFPSQAPDDQFAFRAILGGWKRPDVADMDEASVVRLVREDLQTTLGITAMPAFHWLCRWKRAIPQYHLGHLDRLGRIERRRAGLPGLFLGGNGLRGVALNDCVADGSRIAGEVNRYLQTL